MLDANPVDCITDGIDDGRAGGGADSSIPVTDADYSAGGCDGLQVFVTQVAGAYADTFDAGVRDQYWRVVMPSTSSISGREA